MAQITLQFLDVGQGDGIYIEFPNGITMLVDLGNTHGRAKKVTPPDIYKYFATYTKFKKKGETLNYLIITHPDSDHYNMVDGFLATLQPNVEFYTYGGPSGSYSSPSWMTNVKKAGAKLFTIPSLPTQIKRTGGFGDGVEVWCLAYDTAATSKKSAKGWVKNTCSIVLQIVYNKTKIMLTGDATFDTEKAILTRFQKKDLKLAYLQSRVLKVAHHGSARTSSCKQWIAAVNPEVVFISSDRSGALDEDEKTGHRLPQELTLDIIRHNAPNLSTEYKAHTYVSSYDPQDYVKYASIDSTLKDSKPTEPNPYDKDETGWERAWYAISTKEGIFSNLVSIGEGTDADQGCQYELTITDKGMIGVASTATFQDVAMSTD